MTVVWMVVELSDFRTGKFVKISTRSKDRLEAISTPCESTEKSRMISTDWQLAIIVTTKPIENDRFRPQASSRIYEGFFDSNNEPKL